MDQIDPNDIPLRDIHLPEAISWWPLTFGWWLGLVLIIIAASAVWWYFRKPRKDNNKLLLKSLDTIEQQYLREGNAHELAKRLSVLARQITLLDDTTEKAPRALVGAEWSQSWVSRLEENALSADELHHALSIAPYRKDETVDGETLINAFRSCLQQAQSASGHDAR